jgi:pyridoxal phosphate-dependent aminotransferase EpsN
VFVSTLTFSASVNPIRYLGANPVFIDSELASWNMDPYLLERALNDRANRGHLPRVLILVHLYGQCADIDPIANACERFGVTLIEDAAEALGATYKGRSAGTFGKAGVFSFNGNKIITTSGGGMLASRDKEFIARALKLATQAREPATHYEHKEIGYNYRLSNVLAGIGRAQLAVLPERVRARRANFDFYRKELGSLPGLQFMPEAPWGLHTRWLTTVMIDPREFGTDREALRLALEDANIEARPIWKPMHQQTVFAEFSRYGGKIAEQIFRNGLCLPSGSNLAANDLERIVNVIHDVHSKRPKRALRITG